MILIKCVIVHVLLLLGDGDTDEVPGFIVACLDVAGALAWPHSETRRLLPVHVRVHAVFAGCMWSGRFSWTVQYSTAGFGCVGSGSAADKEYRRGRWANWVERTAVGIKQWWIIALFRQAEDVPKPRWCDAPRHVSAKYLDGWGLKLNPNNYGNHPTSSQTPTCLEEGTAKALSHRI
uniref:Secreted protein n=1 Tax=Oryza brachyantha TaxID=4533 RepID=J3LS46_ORYBR